LVLPPPRAPSARHCSVLARRPPPRPTLSPYTTLFRSREGQRAEHRQAERVDDQMGDAGPEIDGAGEHGPFGGVVGCVEDQDQRRSEEHTSELQSRENLVCRLLLEKKN